MRKILFATLLALIFSVQSFCSAATIESACFNGNEKIVYPVVHTGNEAIDQKINVKIKEELMDFIKGIHYAAQYDNRKVLDAQMNYKVACNGAGNTVILSLLISKSKYFEGAAHPSSYLHVLNINMSSGNRMGLNYLTDIGSGVSVEELKARLERKLQEKAKREKLYLFPEALPLKNLPENFYWDENLHVHFIFQQYEVAPYATGIIDVDIDA